LIPFCGGPENTYFRDDSESWITMNIPPVITITRSNIAVYMRKSLDLSRVCRNSVLSFKFDGTDTELTRFLFSSIL